MPQQRKDMIAVVERLENDLANLKATEPATTFDRYAPVAADTHDCEVRYHKDTGKNAENIGHRIAQVLTALMRQNGWHFTRLATESGINSITNVKRILQGGWKLLHVGHFARLCVALNTSPAWVIQEALKKDSSLRKLGKWKDEDLRLRNNPVAKKGTK